MAQTELNQQALAAAFESAQQRKAFYFEPASRLQLVDKLEHLSRFSDFLLIITGEKGAGKTTLLDQLRVPETDTTLCACILSCVQPVNVSVLLRTLAQQLPVDIPEQADNRKLLSLIYEACNLMAAQGMQWLVMVDDAEKLGKDALEFLLHLLTDAAALSAKPHVILFGQPELMTRLQQEHEIDQLDGQTHHQELQPFSEDEAKSYVIQRYKAAQSLNDGQLRQLYEISGGLPGELNQAVENLFRAGEVSQSGGSKGLPKLHLVSIATVLIGVLLISLWQYWPQEPETADERSRVQLDLPVEPGDRKATTIEVADETVTRQILPVPSLDAEEPTKSEESPVSKALSKIEAEKARQSEAESADDVAEAPVIAETVAAVAQTLPVVRETTTVAVTKPKAEVKAETKAAPQPQPEKTVVKAAAPEPVVPVAVSKPAPKPTPKSEPVVAKPAEKVEPAKVAVAVKPQATPKPVTKPAASKPKADDPKQLSASEKALLEWPTSGYTLQVLGAGLRKSADDFIKAQREPQKFYLFRTTYKGNPWYVVVYGQYKSRQSASAASKSLADDLRKLQPWARSIQGIQSEIKK